MKAVLTGRFILSWRWLCFASALVLFCLSVVPCRAQVPTYPTGSIVRTNFGFQNRYRWTNDNGQVFTPSNTVFRLSDFEGKIVMFEFFAVWCGNCQGAIGQMTNGIRAYFQNRNGTSNGIPVVYVIANLEPSSSWQTQTDAYLPPRNIRICGNDYTPTSINQIRNLFGPPGGTNSSNPRPVYAIINCVSNSPSHAMWQVLAAHAEPGGGAEDYTARINAWRNAMDSVQAPPPRLTGAKRVGGTFEFVVPGQRGRTNRVEATTDFAEWTTVTNLFGTNAAITIRDTNASVNPSRSYRVVRP
jgi:thiol-disulfide isomerase/thioredoxin